MSSKTADVSIMKRNRDFLKFWIGQTISNFGSSITFFALPLLAYKLTGSAVSIGIITSINFIPYLLFGLLLGAWTDQVDRKRLMILADIARGTVIALIPLLAALDLLSIWYIYIIGFTHTILTICFESAQFAVIPSLVSKDDLVVANSRVQAGYSIANIIAPLFAGLLTVFMPLPMILLIDSFSFIISAISLFYIASNFNIRNDESKKKSHNLGRSAFEGLRYVLNHPILRYISVMIAMVNLLSSTTVAQIVFFAKQQLQTSDTQVGLLYSAGSIGGVVLSLAAGKISKHLSFSKVALGSLMLQGLAILTMTLTQWYWLVLILWALCSGLSILFNISTTSLRQAIVPNQMLGRVMSTAMVIAWSVIPLGTLAGGWIIEQTQNVGLVFRVIGILVFFIPFAFLCTPLGHAETYLEEKSYGDME